MKYIDETKIWDILSQAKEPTAKTIQTVLNKSKALKRLTLKETASLLMAKDAGQIKKILNAAAYVKQKIYGNRVVLFVPLYLSNICSNHCLYCSFNASNKKLTRRSLTIDQIKNQVSWLLKRGHKRILIVAGETNQPNIVDYYTQAIKAIYSVKEGRDYIRRININCAPLNTAGFRKLKGAGIGTYQLFQETYHDQTYRYVHPRGPKNDPNSRITALDRAFRAGIDDLGIGVLYGLYNHKFETLAMLSHIEHMEKNYGVGPHTISVPRLEPAFGANFSKQPPYPVSDQEFIRLIAILRLSVPYTGLILSTREPAQLRDKLFNLGISQVSAESNTAPGGYLKQKGESSQFDVSDHRTLDQVIQSLLKNKLIPSFCAACYRKERTGKKFMNLAKPGTIKGMCSLNALITLKEYLTDFASTKTKRLGEQLIKQTEKNLNQKEKNLLANYFKHIQTGQRDEFI